MKKCYLILLVATWLCIDCTAQKKAQAIAKPISRQANLTDSALLDTVQQQTFKYFWDFAFLNTKP